MHQVRRNLISAENAVIRREQIIDEVPLPPEGLFSSVDFEVNEAIKDTTATIIQILDDYDQDNDQNKELLPMSAQHTPQLQAQLQSPSTDELSLEGKLIPLDPDLLESTAETTRAQLWPYIEMFVKTRHSVVLGEVREYLLGLSPCSTGRNGEWYTGFGHRVSSIMSTYANDPLVPIIRVSSVSSGRYRYVRPDEDLAALTAAQPHKSRPAPTVASTQPAQEQEQLECLFVLARKDDMVLVRDNDGNHYKAILEPVF